MYATYLVSRLTLLLIAICCLCGLLESANAGNKDMSFIDQQIASHSGQTGALVLDKGKEALLARAWLADQAQRSIEVQYFIWSTDNIGILASEALLRAAERGVQVRVIIDDLLIDAPDKTLLALSLHPNISIRIYNPKHSVGTSFFRRLLNIITDFRGVNQRMHDKTFIVDGKIAITGGRNMADEYFDYNQDYNFRDRDILVMGKVVEKINWSFNQFWTSELSNEVQQIFASKGILENNVSVNSLEIKEIYLDLHDYARVPENFAPEVRMYIQTVPEIFQEFAKNIIWTDAVFVSDVPGKNNETSSLEGGGFTTQTLAELVKKSTKKIVIQSPYLILSDKAEALFKDTRNRGVEIVISTNSLASTDNLQAFSGYKNQRQDLLDLGIKIFEYKPYPEIQLEHFADYKTEKSHRPVFAIHAKTMVVDSNAVYIGTYNLDPRSENLNTEVGVIIHDSKFAKTVEDSIKTDMAKQNSWDSSIDKPDQYASFWKRVKVLFWQFMPMKALL